MKSAVTVSLVPEATHGPFVFHGDLVGACRTAKELGFDGIELYAPGPDTVPRLELMTILNDHGLKLAAVGTGAGWVQNKLTLTSPDARVRRRAIEFIASMIDYGAALGAPAIIGSMQGRWGDGVSREQALKWLAEALIELDRRTPGTLLYEPLNRYESNLLNTLADTERFLNTIVVTKVKILADLFHMNIEETHLPDAIKNCQLIGHVHLADNTRGPAGSGHTHFKTIAVALLEKGFDGFVSAEAFPQPNARAATEMTMSVFRNFFSEVI